jgi:hypothetical protein
MINDPVDNLQIDLFEGPDSLINFALSKKFDERLPLTRSIEAGSGKSLSTNGL